MNVTTNEDIAKLCDQAADDLEMSFTKWAKCVVKWRARAAAIRALPPHRFVPVEPTDKMVVEGLAHGGVACGLAYSDMLAASPEIELP